MLLLLGEKQDQMSNLPSVGSITKTWSFGQSVAEGRNQAMAPQFFLQRVPFKAKFGAEKDWSGKGGQKFD